MRDERRAPRGTGNHVGARRPDRDADDCPPHQQGTGNHGGAHRPDRDADDWLPHRRGTGGYLGDLTHRTTGSRLATLKLLEFGLNWLYSIENIRAEMLREVTVT